MLAWEYKILGAWMRKHFIIFLLSIFAVLLFEAPVRAYYVRDEEPLIIGVPVDRCPVFYIDQDTGELVGIGVDLMRVVVRDAGYEPLFVVIREDTLKEALDNDEYDVIMPFGSAISSEAGKESIVTENIIRTPFTLVTAGDKNLPSLNEMKIGMLSSLGGVADTVEKLYMGIEITMYDSMSDCVKALREGEVDALLHNSYVWSYVLQKPSYSDLKLQPAVMFSMDFKAGTLNTPEGQVVIDRLNKGIKLLSDTRRQAVTLDYTSRRLYKYDAWDYFYMYWRGMILFVLVLAALIAYLVSRLRKQSLEQEMKVRDLLEKDPLTGALNMDGFRKRVKEILTANPDVPYLLSFSNIKNFKFVNDSLGWKAGDELLCFWVNKSIPTLSDSEAVARVTGDRIAVLRRNGGGSQMEEDRLNVIEPVRNYFLARGKEIKIQICTGVYALTPEDYKKIDVDHMLDCARMAEKKLRQASKEGYEVYNLEQWEKGKQLVELCSHLPTALKTGEIEVWYQPQMDYEVGKISGAEALCRWNHCELGWISPGVFIPILEDAGFIFDLDSFVWQRVCQDLKRWNDEGRHRSASVNLSRQDIREDRNIPEHFRKLIKKYGISPDQLRIEITETAYAEHPEFLIETTVQLRKLGFQVEMDDFGSGYSSLHMLKEVPVDRIKMDLHFLTKTGDMEKSRTIITYVIRMISALGMKLIAEGVETSEQADFLKEKGCTEMQGYYFYKPMPVEEFEKIHS